MILSQTFERSLDRKDAMLKALAADLDEADMQMDRAAQGHASKVDQLVAFHEKLIEDVSKKRAKEDGKAKWHKPKEKKGVKSQKKKKKQKKRKKEKEIKKKKKRK